MPWRHARRGLASGSSTTRFAEACLVWPGPSSSPRKTERQSLLSFHAPVLVPPSPPLTLPPPPPPALPLFSLSDESKQSEWQLDSRRGRGGGDIYPATDPSTRKSTLDVCKAGKARRRQRSLVVVTVDHYIMYINETASCIKRLFLAILVSEVMSSVKVEMAILGSPVP